LDSDYTRTVGTLTFGTGITSQTISVPILGDSTWNQSPRNFSVKLSNPIAGFSLIDDTGTGTIVDDEGPVATINDVQVDEGDNGTKQMIFTVTVTGTVNGTVQLNYTTVNGTATTADFTTTSGTLNFTSAGRRRSSSNHWRSRERGRPDFFIKLTADTDSAAVAIADDTGTGTIQDNDPTPQISIEGGKIAEGNSGLSQIRYTIKLDRPSDKEVTVDFQPWMVADRGS
jgi:serralysin